MSDHSSRLSLPYILPAQAQKHVTHNEAIRQLDFLVQLSVESLDATTPPASPIEGAAYALGTGATGDWASQDNSIAVFADGAWRFATPQEGWRLYARDVGALRIWDGSTWAALPHETDNLDGVGIGTSHDSTNRLAVASDATLLSHDGDDHQVKINKAATTDTGSILFQTNWSGRAEMGLAGEDDFSFKTSPDGSTWTTGLSFSATDATTTLPKPVTPNGIHVGGTAPANHLAIYETGSYTPNLIDQSGNSVSLAPVEVKWVRIGSLVTIFFGPMLNISTVGLVASDVVALDVPFTSDGFGFGFVELAGPVARPGPFHWTAQPGTTQARIRCTGTGFALTVSDLTSGSTHIIGGTLNTYVV